ncbi:MAG: RICIN domain-containing protein, partial [Firmicutes bacterium]|nr:RICIN domain-containing protein [Bacillota bacterium]
IDIGDWADLVFMDPTGQKALTEVQKTYDLLFLDYEEGNQSQIFRAIKRPDGSYKIKSMQTGRCIDLNNNSSKEGARVGTHTDNGSNAQKWIIRKNGDTYILQKPGSQLVIGLNDSGTTAVYYYSEESTAFTVPDIITSGGLTGDVNGNGTLESADTDWILKYLSNKSVLDQSQSITADFDTNGTVNILDAIKLEAHIAQQTAAE